MSGSLILLTGREGSGKTTLSRELKPRFDHVESLDPWDYDKNPEGPPADFDKKKVRSQKANRALSLKAKGKHVLLEGYLPGYLAYPRLHGKFDSVVELDPGVITRHSRLVKRTLKRGRSIPKDYLYFYKQHFTEGRPARKLMQEQEKSYNVLSPEEVRKYLYGGAKTSLASVTDSSFDRKASDKNKHRLRELVRKAGENRYLKRHIRGATSRRAIVHEDEVVGFTSPRAGHLGQTRVGPIYIDQAHRGKGLASKALQQIVQERGPSYAFIEDGNRASMRAFSSAGFTRTDREDRWGGGYWWRHGGMKKTAAEEKQPKPRYAPTLKEWFQPYPHQARAIERAYANGGNMILAHQTGLGKTAAGIALRERLRADGLSSGAVVVVPSGLRHNFAEEGIGTFTDGVQYQIVGSQAEAKPGSGVIRLGQEKHVDKGGPQYTIISYDLFRRDPVGVMQRSGADTLIYDEFHAVRNESSQNFSAAMAARPYARSFIGLTASPVNNHPKELATLLTISEGRRLISPRDFERAFFKTVGYETGFGGSKVKKQELKNAPILVSEMYPKVDVVTTDSVRKGEMPRKEVEEIEVEMSEEQYKLYRLALSKVGDLEKYLIMRDPNISVKEANTLFGQLIEARRISNSMHTGRKDISLKNSADRTPKLKRLLDDVQKELDAAPENKAVIYSNLVRGGIDAISAGLTARGVKHGIFTGKGTELNGQVIDSNTRQQAVKDYKEGKNRVIVLSGAGAEGLNLKDSTAFFALDGHFNPERITQAEARAVRIGGQQFRQPEDRRVKVHRYINVAPASKQPGAVKRFFGAKAPVTTDQWMYGVAKGKEQKTQEVSSALAKPHKYINKYRDARGNWRYVYPEDRSNIDSATVDSMSRPTGPAYIPPSVTTQNKKPGWFSSLWSRG